MGKERRKKRASRRFRAKESQHELFLKSVHNPRFCSHSIAATTPGVFPTLSGGRSSGVLDPRCPQNKALLCAALQSRGNQAGERLILQPM